MFSRVQPHITFYQLHKSSQEVIVKRFDVCGFDVRKCGRVFFIPALIDAINRRSISLNMVHNVFEEVYLCTCGAIYLMYWYVYFNLFLSLILWLWPWNQYFNLRSTSFNPFFARILFSACCFWLDRCKQSTRSLFFSAACLLSHHRVGGNGSLQPVTGCRSSSSNLYSLLHRFCFFFLNFFCSDFHVSAHVAGSTRFWCMKDKELKKVVV